MVLITAAPANPYSALIPSGAIWGENCSKFSSQTRVTCPSVAVGERDQTAWPSHAYTETLRTRQAGACGGGHPPRGACQHGSSLVTQRSVSFFLSLPTLHTIRDYDFLSILHYEIEQHPRGPTNTRYNFDLASSNFPIVLYIYYVLKSTKNFTLWST